jgi:hypothetical protein
MDPHVRLKLETALIAHDRRQAKGKHHNPHALAIYLRALQEATEATSHGHSLARALHDHFNGRLLSALERAAGLELTYGGGGHDRGRPA